MTFGQLGINEAITQALLENKISQPSDIQRKAIPHILKNETDLVSVAQTGTGKTAAFCLPILQTINPGLAEIQALVLVPTRELGQQVAREFFLFSKHMPRIFTECVYGGVPIDEHIQRLKRSTHVVVATPGRLLDLLERKALNLQNLKFVVLDEADEMMNMGFKTEIDKILNLCKNDVRKLLFTATMPADVTAVIRDYIRHDAVTIRINAEEFINQNIEHSYIIYNQGEKLDYLKAFLSERKDQRGILFCRTKTAAKRLSKQLAGFEVTADALHGNLNQEMRDKVMRGLRKGRISLLIATDIAARGIDVKELDYIIHYHLPEKSDQYTHRSGRTARAGKSGLSVCLIRTEDLTEIKTIESNLKIKFTEISVKLPNDTKHTHPIGIQINLGLIQGFTKNNLVEFLVEEAGLSTGDVKNIRVNDNSAYFEVSARYETQIFINFKGYKVAHRNVKMTVVEVERD
ncbi:MAG: DEAD/DEAH box helicase [Paludibacter sp.]|nr:DEAD/DEAH box helicase [Paludibacter sp.]MDD3490937.1 DEAD/DEAH box helicase [Paludibacter sp.]